MVKDKLIRITGWFYNPPVREKNYTGWVLHETEVPKFAKALKNKPILDTHIKTLQIGYVDKVYQDKVSTALALDALLYNTPEALSAFERVLKGELCGFSVGWKAGRNEDWERITELSPFEISLVPKGDRPGSRIFEIDAMGTKMVLPQHIVYSANASRPSTTMTEEQQSITQDANTSADHSAEEIQQGLQLLKEKREREAAEVAEKKRKVDEMIRGPLVKNWEDACNRGVIQFNERFGKVVNAVAAMEDGPILLECLNSSLALNTTELESKRKEVADKKAAEQSKRALATPEERTVPTGGYETLFSKPKPIEVESLNSSSAPAPAAPPAGGDYASLFARNPEKRARLETEFARGLNAPAPSNA
jgi:hypothetical protein